MGSCLTLNYELIVFIIYCVDCTSVKSFSCTKSYRFVSD